MGAGKHLMISATGFPGTNKTWRFLQSAFREPLEALAKLSGEKTILTGLVQSSVGGATVVSDGFISFAGEILPFVGGAIDDSVTLIENIESVNYDVDIDNDGVQDSLPGYKTRYLKFGSDGIESFPFSDLARLKTIKELSEFSLPEGIVIDVDYLAFTQSMLDHLNSIEEGAEKNVNANWNETQPSSDKFIENKPFTKIQFAHGKLTTSNRQVGQWINDFTKNYAYIYPPSGFAITDLASFVPSIGQIYFNGNVGSDDTLFCNWKNDVANNRIVVICNNSENRQNSVINYLAIWKK